jgi:anti-sigma factor RsiW
MKYFSALTLERYNLGEIGEDEKHSLEQALAEDNALAARLAEIRRSDAEIRGLPAYRENQDPGRVYRRFPRAGLKHPRRVIIIAAAMLCLGLPVIGYLGLHAGINGITKDNRMAPTDRLKGTGSEPQTPFISLYLKTSGNSPVLNSAEEKERVTLR